ncbi:MAG: UDP-N-acetylmuramoyl-tripeptide--D-alanyl-D-alanine ligase, partial [Bdellovibrionales bacterium]
LKAKVFAITGSNGKTSTKEFLATILAESFKVHYSKGSFNNHWGVPFSILAASKSDEVLILEMGMNHAGEISKLVEIAIPDVVLCTMVGRAHIGNFGGKQAEIAKAKEEIYLSSPNAISIFNLDDAYTRKMFVHFKKRNMRSSKKILTFSKSKSQKICDVQLHVSSASFKGLIIEGQIGKTKKKVLVPVIGEHNVVNLMAASAMALAAKMPVSKIWKGLSKCQSEWGRNQLVQLDGGTQILFDAYNANPDSMSAMIQNIKKIQKAPKKMGRDKMSSDKMGRVFLVLGEMLELGDQTKKSHQELGEQVGALNCSAVWFMGESQKEFEKGFYAAQKPSGKKSARQLWAKSGINKINNNLIISSGYEESLAIRMRSMLNPQDVVIMKGSRGMKLEKVLLCWHPNFKTKNN